MDLLLDGDGDLRFDETGDFAVDTESIKIDIREIIALNKGNEYHAPHIGVGIYRLLNNTSPQARTSIQQDTSDNMAADGIKKITIGMVGSIDNLTINAYGTRNG
jgi:hypothetical protein